MRKRDNEPLHTAFYLHFSWFSSRSGGCRCHLNASYASCHVCSLHILSNRDNFNASPVLPAAAGCSYWACIASDVASAHTDTHALQHAYRILVFPVSQLNSYGHDGRRLLLHCRCAVEHVRSCSDVPVLSMVAMHSSIRTTRFGFCFSLLHTLNSVAIRLFTLFVIYHRIISLRFGITFHV